MNGQNKTAIFSKQYNTVTLGTKRLSLQTLQSNQQGQYCYTATLLTYHVRKSGREGRWGTGGSAGVVVLLRPRGGCVAGKIPAV